MDRTSEDAFQKQKLALQKLDIEYVMGTENGRRFVWRLLEYAGIYRDINGDDLEMAKAVGNRQAGLYLMGIISDVAEDQVFIMMKEAKNQALTEEGKDERKNRNTGSEDRPNSNFPNSYDTERGDHGEIRGSDTSRAGIFGTPKGFDGLI